MKISLKNGILLIEDANNRSEIIINSDRDIYFDMHTGEVNLDGLEVTAYSDKVDEIFEKAGVKT